MLVGVIGIGYKTSLRTEVQERFLKNCREGMCDSNDTPFVLLSTCNRTELYYSGRIPENILSGISEEVMGDFYSYAGRDCFLHLTRVVAGADSIIFGETDISGQVKKAYQEACLRSSLPSSLHYIFQKAFKIGKEIRNRFSLPKTSIALEKIVVEIVMEFFASFERFSVLFIGYSTVNRKISEEIARFKNADMYLATEVSNTVLREENTVLSRLPQRSLDSWGCFDAVIAAGKYRNPLSLPESSVARLIIDLGFPKNIDLRTGSTKSIIFRNIQDITRMLEERTLKDCSEYYLVSKAIYDEVKGSENLYRRKRERDMACV